MELIKESKNLEFDVIYDDGKRKRVKEGVLHEVENEEVIFHNGTDRAEVWIAAAEDMLKALAGVPGGIESLLAGMAADNRTEKVVSKMRGMLRAVHELEKEESAEKQAIFRLGQMDMLESLIAFLEDRKQKLEPIHAQTLFLDDLIQEVKKMGGQVNGQ